MSKCKDGQWLGEEPNLDVVLLDEVDAPGIGGKPFKLIGLGNNFCPGDILQDYYKRKFLVISNPHKKWYKLLLQYLTFTLYRATWEYQVEPTD